MEALFPMSTNGTPPPTKRSSFSTAGVPFHIEFAENLTISRCCHRLRSDNRPEDSTLLDLNQLEPVGGATINMEHTSDGTIKMTFLAQFVYHDNRTEQLSIESSVDQNFSLVNEIRDEKSVFGERKLNKTWTRGARCRPFNSGGLLVDFCHADDIGNAHHEQRIHKVTSNCHNQSFWLEGNGMIMKRMWVLSGYVGTIDCDSVDVHGAPCKLRYVCKRRRSAIFNGARHQIMRIKQIKFDEQNGVDVAKSIYLLSGHLLRHKFRWYDNAYIMHLNPLLSIPPDMDIYPEPAVRFFEQFTLNDVQSTEIDFGAVIERDPSMRCLVQYFLLSLISEKPEKIVQYTIDYFMRLGFIHRDD